MRQMQCTCMNIFLHFAAKDCLQSDIVFWWLRKVSGDKESCKEIYWTGYMYLTVN